VGARAIDAVVLTAPFAIAGTLLLRRREQSSARARGSAPARQSAPHADAMYDSDLITAEREKAGLAAEHLERVVRAFAVALPIVCISALFPDITVFGLTVSMLIVLGISARARFKYCKTSRYIDAKVCYSRFMQSSRGLDVLAARQTFFREYPQYGKILKADWDREEPRSLDS